MSGIPLSRTQCWMIDSSGSEGKSGFGGTKQLLEGWEIRVAVFCESRHYLLVLVGL